MSHIPSTHTVSNKVGLPPLGRGPYNRRLGVIAVVVSFGGLLFGYDTGVMNGALAFIVQYFGLNPVQEGFISFSLLIGAAIGAVGSGPLADSIGRRKIVLILSVVFLAGTLGSALSPSFEVMLVFRFILGLAVGGASVTVPIYLAEVAPFERRGSYVTLNNLTIVVGQFLAFLVNAVLAIVSGGQGEIWRVMLAIAAIPAIALLVGMLRLPESPRWLLKRDRDAEALAVLERVRSADRAAAEVEEIRLLLDEEAIQHSSYSAWAEIKSQPWIRRLLVIGAGLAAFQQLTGINTMEYYGSQVLQQAGFGQNVAISLNVLIGVVSVAANITAVIIMNRVNRRTLMLGGFTGIVIAHVLLGTLGTALPDGPVRAWLLLVCMLLFVAIMQCTLGGVLWTVLPELLPLRLRGVGMGLTVLALWITNAIVSLTFPPLVSALGFGTFLVFAFLGCLALIFIGAAVPETRGRTLEELEEKFENLYSRV